MIWKWISGELEIRQGRLCKPE